MRRAQPLTLAGPRPDAAGILPVAEERLAEHVGSTRPVLGPEAVDARGRPARALQPLPLEVGHDGLLLLQRDVLGEPLEILLCADLVAQVSKLRLCARTEDVAELVLDDGVEMSEP